MKAEPLAQGCHPPLTFQARQDSWNLALEGPFAQSHILGLNLDTLEDPVEASRLGLSEPTVP